MAKIVWGEYIVLLFRTLGFDNDFFTWQTYSVKTRITPPKYTVSQPWRYLDIHHSHKLTSHKNISQFCAKVSTYTSKKQSASKRRRSRTFMGQNITKIIDLICCLTQKWLNIETLTLRQKPRNKKRVIRAFASLYRFLTF